MFDVQVSEGDITRVESDALITVINSEGMWFGGIDSAIQRVAGNTFHDQARRQSLQDGQAIYATASGAFETSFRSVIFVVDDLKQPLHKLVVAGLHKAEDQGCHTVTLPLFRTGVMIGAFEGSKEQALDELVWGIEQFWATTPWSSMTSVQIVVYNDSDAAHYLRNKLQPQ